MHELNWAKNFKLAEIILTEKEVADIPNKTDSEIMGILREISDMSKVFRCVVSLEINDVFYAIDEKTKLNLVLKAIKKNNKK